MNEDHAGRGEVDLSEIQRRKGRLLSGDHRDPQKTGAYQLYTLYRDRDSVVRQAPASGCHCRPLFQKLEGQIQATQEEMKSHMVSFQDQINVQLGRMHRRNRHQIKVLDMVNQERAATEREDFFCRIEQRVEQGREETLRSQQAAISRDMKRWCVSQMKDMDLLPTPEPYTLLPSPSVERSLADTDLLESTLPLLALVPGDSSSSTSLATYVNVFPSLSSSSTLTNGDHHQTPESKYFEIKVERSPEDYENTALLTLPTNCSSGLLVSSADPYWPPGVMLHRSMAPQAIMGLGRDRGSSSCSSSSSQLVGGELATAKPREAKTLKNSSQRLGKRYGWPCKRQLSEPMLAHRQATAGTSNDTAATLEFFINRPVRPTFIQERNNLHAMEVTQQFFETVSMQLERWYERKVQEAKRQAELRAQQDTEQLLQRITTLEEELQRLTPNDKTEST
ncbi:unnamed protein product [Merluccius merluccius]